MDIYANQQCKHFGHARTQTHINHLILGCVSALGAGAWRSGWKQLPSNVKQNATTGRPRALKRTCLRENVHIAGSSERGRKLPTRDGDEQYLRPGRTCWTAALRDCVHWPPGPGHTGPESKRFLPATRSVSSRRQRRHAARARRQTCTCIRW